jgi:hypothetical protein
LHPGPVDGVGLVDDDGGQDPGFCGPRAAPAKDKGVVEGRGWGGVPYRRLQGASCLRVLLRARIQPPCGGLLPRLVVLLQVEAGTSCPQLHYYSVELHSFL